MKDKEKKAIIALWGPQGTGKTTTLRKLALQFLESEEVDEDIQIGFLCKKPQKNSEENSKVVVSTISGDINQAFYTAFDRSLILVKTTRTKDKTGKIKVDADLVEKEKAKPEQERIDIELQPKIKDLIESKAKALEETAALREFFLKLLESEVVEGDIQIAFRYKGKRIVISTAGDGEDTVDESTSLFEKLEADILVTTTRSKSSKAYKKLKKHKPGKPEIDVKTIWIHKVCSCQRPIKEDEEQRKIIQELIKEEQTKSIQKLINEEEEQSKVIQEFINEKQAESLKSLVDLIL